MRRMQSSFKRQFYDRLKHNRGINLDVANQQIFPHTCDIYSVSHPKDFNKKPGVAVYKLEMRNVACCYHYTLNIDDPTAVMGNKRATIFTTDVLDFPPNLVILNGWLTKDRTARADGTDSPNAGTVHAIGGQSQTLSDGISTLSEKQVFLIMQEEHPDI